MAGEMDWFFNGTLGAVEIHAYERRLNKLLDEYPDVTIVCQYDITQFSVAGVLLASPRPSGRTASGGFR